MKNKECTCFLCKNKDNKDLTYGYEVGYYEAMQYVLNSLKELNIKPSNVSDKTINGLMACINYELIAVGTMMDESIKERKEVK